MHLFGFRWVVLRVATQHDHLQLPPTVGKELHLLGLPFQEAPSHSHWSWVATRKNQLALKDERAYIRSRLHSGKLFQKTMEDHHLIWDKKPTTIRLGHHPSLRKSHYQRVHFGVAKFMVPRWTTWFKIMLPIPPNGWKHSCSAPPFSPFLGSGAWASNMGPTKWWISFSHTKRFLAH